MNDAFDHVTERLGHACSRLRRQLDEQTTHPSGVRSAFRRGDLPQVALKYRCVSTKRVNMEGGIATGGERGGGCAPHLPCPTCFLQSSLLQVEERACCAPQTNARRPQRIRDWSRRILFDWHFHHFSFQKNIFLDKRTENDALCPAIVRRSDGT